MVPLGPLTLLVGKNGSGKSNVLDGLAVLAAIASGQTLRDALDGGREGPIVRGGSEGCAPAGDDSFSIGCTTDINGKRYHLDLKIGVSESVQILSEHLWTKRTHGAKVGEPLDLLKTEAPQPHSGDIVARWENGKRGLNPPVVFRAAQLLTSQVATRVPATSAAGREVHLVASQVLQALQSVFLLDPVPHQMREYVPEKDSKLRRSADNLSAVLSRLLQSPDTRTPLLEMTRALSEAQVSDLSTVTSDLGDVMITVEEKLGSRIQPMPARLMSDGTLRFLAIAAALLDEPRDELDSGPDGRTRLLVVEELENGLHPSQAALLLSRLKASSKERRVRTFASTHSPAILDALTGSDHRNVVVCSRRPDGWSAVTRLTDFPDYFEVVGRDTLGKIAMEDSLRPSVNEGRSKTLAEVLGI